MQKVLEIAKNKESNYKDEKKCLLDDLLDDYKYDEKTQLSTNEFEDTITKPIIISENVFNKLRISNESDLQYNNKEKKIPRVESNNNDQNKT